jgi:hypothetical protein
VYKKSHVDEFDPCKSARQRQQTVTLDEAQLGLKQTDLIIFTNQQSLKCSQDCSKVRGLFRNRVKMTGMSYMIRRPFPKKLEINGISKTSSHGTPDRFSARTRK